MKPFVAQGFDWYTIYWRGSPCKQGKRSGFTADFRGKKRIGQRLNARRYVCSERWKGSSRGEPRSILFDAYRNAPESVPHHSEPVGKEGGRGKGYPGRVFPALRVSLPPARRIFNTVRSRKDQPEIPSSSAALSYRERWRDSGSSPAFFQSSMACANPRMG